MGTDWLAFLARRGWPWLLLVGLWAAVYLTRLGDNELYYEEGRRATPARQMLLSGDLVVPRLYGEVYLHKPPVFLWLITGTGALLGQVQEWAVRLPSALSVLAGLVLVYRFGHNRLDRPTRLIAALFTLSCAMLVEKGRLGEIDLFLSVVVLAALGLWWRGYESGGPGLVGWLGVGLLLGVAALTKGPAGPFLFYLPVVCFLLWQRQPFRLLSLGHLLGVLVSLAPMLLWLSLLVQREGLTWAQLIATWRREAGVDAAVYRFTVDRTSGLAGQAMEAVRFIGYFLVGCLPAWPMIFSRGLAGLRQQLRDDALARFLLCAFLPALLIVWLWPIGRARHALFVCYPVCLLAAMQAGPGAAAACHRLWLLLARWIVWAPAAVAVASVAVISTRTPTALPQVVPAAALLVVVSVLSGAWTLRTPLSAGRIALGANAALLLASVGFACSVCKSEVVDRRPQRHLRQRLDELCLADVPICTTSSYSRGVGVDFNAQFYLGPRLQAVRSIDQLPDAPALVVAIHSGEREALLRCGRYRVLREVNLGRLPLGDELLVLEVARREAVSVTSRAFRPTPRSLPYDGRERPSPRAEINDAQDPLAGAGRVGGRLGVDDGAIQPAGPQARQPRRP